MPVNAIAQTTSALPSPLGLGDVIRLASERRDEIQAARARIRAGEARPAIVSALADPMISPSLDHLPFMLGGADVSFTIEQQIPLSGIRGHRRASALADVDRLRAEASRTTLDVGLQAVNAFLMVQERRRTAALVTEQLVVRARRGQRRQCPLRQRNRAAVGCAARRGRGGPARSVCPRARERGAWRRSHAQHEPRAGRGRAGAAASRLSRSRSRLLPGRPSRRR